ncbi:c-type cytochrome [Deinococcus sp. Marseille-Q6407]|uniref:c-type cytochrome n=1 Tax=Deinococcus sp. Marseille-Q6407 TaxID=2969223 RepID=UPI0021C15C33|nr:cytochrome c [Deinococcus sp. Marseille-Q6407]
MKRPGSLLRAGWLAVALTACSDQPSRQNDAATASPAAAASNSPAHKPAVAASGTASKPHQPAAQAEAPGQRSFNKHCAGCHGSAAGGGFGPALRPAARWSPERFTAAVRQGRGAAGPLLSSMPRFTPEVLSDASLAQIQHYLRTLP